jgi:hypothetical protein
MLDVEYEIRDVVLRVQELENQVQVIGAAVVALQEREVRVALDEIEAAGAFTEADEADGRLRVQLALTEEALAAEQRAHELAKAALTAASRAQGDYWQRPNGRVDQAADVAAGWEKRKRGEVS